MKDPKASEKAAVPAKDATKNGKGKDADTKPEEEELSEEDRQLQEELELCVTRLKEPDTNLYISALEILRRHIRSSTTSMTSVPKPLKFLRKHYDELKQIYENMQNDEAKRFAADIVSILSMTMPPEKYAGESLKYRMLGSREEIGSWGHEYVRHLAGEISYEWQQESATKERKEALLGLVSEIIPYHMAHNAEAEAADLLMEIERLDMLAKYIDNEDVCQRVCLYLISCVPYVADPENTNLLKTALEICLKFKKYPEAIRLAIQLNDTQKIAEIIKECEDSSVRKQMAYILARQQVFPPEDSLGDESLVEIISNVHLNTNFLALARELDIMEPKTPDDIYKTHLEQRPAFGGAGSVDSARANLASSFVNGFVNAGFGKDKLLMVEDGNKWLYKNKDHGMMSATASLGLLMLWDVDGGLVNIDKYLYSNEDNIKAGALLACGIVNCGVRNECDPALALLSDYVTGKDVKPIMRMGATIGLGLAYAGSNRADVLELLIPILENNESSIEVLGVTALACSLVTVGSANETLTTPLIQIFIERDLKVDDPFARFLPLALGLNYLAKQEAAEVILESVKVIGNAAFREVALTLVDICAYAATGNVLKVQNLLHICSERVEEKKEPETTPSSGSTTTPASQTSQATTQSSASATADKDQKKGESEKDKDKDKDKETKQEQYVPTAVHQAIAAIGVAVIAMAEDIGSQMAFRTFGHLLRYGDPMVKRAVPLALALLSSSNPQLNILETLSKFSHDADPEVACNAIFAMGMVGAGTNNARLATMLRQLASFHAKDANALFMVRIAQGLTHLGKGTLSLSPFNSDRQLLVPTALAGLLCTLFSFLDVKQTILSKSHYLLYFLTVAIQPRMLVTFDEELNPLPVAVRVGQAVDVVGQAGKPKTITGFQTHTTPVLLAHGERAELATEEYLPLTPVLEGFVILRKNPEYVA